MNTTALGRMAERAAGEYLEQLGFTILHYNWRTRWCEIDVVAHKDKTIYFVEVKYRRSAKWGEGFAYISAQKLEQMAFAAELWVAKHNWLGAYQLSAIQVGEESLQVTGWLADL